ncbi:MAG: hypothetical protein KAG37_04545 [Flavobacteriales bacterium]|nr:hypothetical protein [Flavobacteriales bacterium]
MDAFFFRTRDGGEVDFVINDKYNLQTFEVKFTNLETTKSYRELISFNNE